MGVLPKSDLLGMTLLISSWMHSMLGIVPWRINGWLLPHFIYDRCNCMCCLAVY